MWKNSRIARQLSPRKEPRKPRSRRVSRGSPKSGGTSGVRILCRTLFQNNRCRWRQWTSNWRTYSTTLNTTCKVSNQSRTRGGPTLASTAFVLAELAITLSILCRVRKKRPLTCTMTAFLRCGKLEMKCWYRWTSPRSPSEDLLKCRSGKIWRSPWRAHFFRVSPGKRSSNSIQKIGITSPQVLQRWIIDQATESYLFTM